MDVTFSLSQQAELDARAKLFESRWPGGARPLQQGATSLDLGIQFRTGDSNIVHRTLSVTSQDPVRALLGNGLFG